MAAVKKQRRAVGGESQVLEASLLPRKTAKYSVYQQAQNMQR
jgi:hypothetical protein